MSKHKAPKPPKETSHEVPKDEAEKPSLQPEPAEETAATAEPGGTEAGPETAVDGGDEPTLDEKSPEAAVANPGAGESPAGDYVTVPPPAGFVEPIPLDNVKATVPDAVSKILANHADLTNPSVASVGSGDPIHAQLDSICELAEELRYVGKLIGGVAEIRAAAPAASIQACELASQAESLETLTDRLPTAFVLGLELLKSRIARILASIRSVD